LAPGRRRAPPVPRRRDVAGRRLDDVEGCRRRAAADPLLVYPPLGHQLPHAATLSDCHRLRPPGARARPSPGRGNRPRPAGRPPPPTPTLGSGSPSTGTTRGRSLTATSSLTRKRPVTWGS